ncbi:MAG TPA: serine/threonine-protein kinase [Gemmatimonadaceae bacterium]|nr:serine/threonine-protein kinase [Gemmatimonadaceae bacterium]
MATPTPRNTPTFNAAVGAPPASPYRVTTALPSHLTEWQLPPEWRWGGEGVWTEFRHYQEVIDALGRSLSLVTATDGAHHGWLAAEARALAHRGHPSVPTTYHYWSSFSPNRRGPGYLRRWIGGETVGGRLRRLGGEDVPYVLQVARSVGSTLAYLHDAGATHGAVSLEAAWVNPTGRLFMLGWQWALPRPEVPFGLAPDRAFMPVPPEWINREWEPTPATDQWQLAASCFAMLVGEYPVAGAMPPLTLVRPGIPVGIAANIDRALSANPDDRFPSVSAFLRALDRGVSARTLILGHDESVAGGVPDGEEARLRWATADDYEVIAALGSGSFGSVWRVRDLTLEREVALKMLHPHVARDDQSVARFRREARLAAQLAHPAIVPIYDWDGRGDVVWYTMELAEGGSVAELIKRDGPRSFAEATLPIAAILDGLAAAHAIGIVHRDLKPENILIDRYRRWRITDFGIANVTGVDRSGGTGTPAFSSPEQLLGEPQGAAADCFAVAAIVVFVLTGQPPFGDADGAQILARELAGPFDAAGYPEPLAAWLKRGLDPDPDKRFADAGEMLAAWRETSEATLARTGRRPLWKRLLGAPLDRAAVITRRG